MEAALIKTDKDTLSKLKVMAGDKSLSAFLRDIANGIEQTPVAVNELESLRGSILSQLEGIKTKLDSFDKYLSNAETNVQNLSDFQGVILKTLAESKSTKGSLNKNINEYWQHRQAPIEEEAGDESTDLTDIEALKKDYKGD